MTLAQAWEAFEKAATFDAKAKDPSTPENLKRVALKGAEKKLDEAVAFEAAALAAGESH